MTVATPEVEDILEHFGTKGMRWGVRKHDYTDSRAAQKQARAELGAPRFRSGLKPSHYKEGRAVKKRTAEIMDEKQAARKAEKKANKEAKKMAKADKKFDKPSMETHTKIYNDGIEHFNKKLDGINNKPEYAAAAKAGILLKADHPITQKYHDEVDATLKAELRASADRVTSPSGTKKYKVEIVQLSQNPHDWGWTLGTEAVQHSMITTRIIAVRDKSGLVTTIKADSMMQADAFVETYLEHYGVKGMRWGKTTKSAPTSEVSVTQKGKKLKTSGGQGVKPHADAVTAAKTKQQVSASGVHSVSNKDLQALAQRMNLEQQVDRLSKNEQANSANFIQKMLHQSGQQEAQKASNAIVAKSVAALLKT